MFVRVCLLLICIVLSVSLVEGFEYVRGQDKTSTLTDSRFNQPSTSTSTNKSHHHDDLPEPTLFATIAIAGAVMFSVVAVTTLCTSYGRPQRRERGGAGTGAGAGTAVADRADDGGDADDLDRIPTEQEIMGRSLLSDKEAAANASPLSVDGVVPSFRSRAATDPFSQVLSPFWQPAAKLEFQNITYDVATSLLDKLTSNDDDVPGPTDLTAASALLPSTPKHRKSRSGGSAAAPSSPSSSSSSSSNSPKAKAATKTRVLHGISGVCKPKQMVAIMGASGAGKSTLLDILALQEKSGTVNGSLSFPCATHTITNPKDLVGYVLQDDRLFPTDTVWETLLLAARMRLAPTVSETEIVDLVEQVISDLRLERVKHSAIGSPDAGGGLSGGERKRVAIGAELVGNPRILLLDEPTSGLDSYSADVVIDVMRRFANKGALVIMTIHQPTTSVFRKFDRLMVLAKGGYQAYFGPPSRAVAHLRAASGVQLADKWVNPAEVVLDICATGTEDEFRQLSNAYFTSALADEVLGEGTTLSPRAPATPSSPSSRATLVRAMSTSGSDLPPYQRDTINSLAKFLLLCGRALRTIYRDPSMLFVQLVVTVTVALLCGWFFYDLNYQLSGVTDRSGFLFFDVVFFSLISTSSLSSLISEKDLFLRERAAGRYTTLPYFASKVLCDILPLRVLPPILFSLIVRGLINLRGGAAHVWTLVIINVLTNLASTALCYAISALAPNVGVANSYAAALFIFNFLFGGMLLSARNTVITIVMYFSFFNWSWKALMANEFQGITHIEFNPPNSVDTIITGDVWARNVGADVVNHPFLIRQGIVILVILLIIALATTFVLLSQFQRFVK